MKLSFFFFLLFIIIKIESKTKTLLCIVEFNRHGARTSKSLSSKTLSKVFGSNMILTPNGFRQHELLGQYMRQRFITNEKFIKEKYDENQFEIFSTPIQRTMQSAIGFIHGFYPNSIVKMNYQESSELSQVINNDTIPLNIDSFKYEEVPINVFSKSNDIFHRIQCNYKGEDLDDKIKGEVQKYKNGIYDLSKMNFTNIAIELGKFLNVDPPEDSNDEENGKYLEDLEKYLQSFLYHYGKTLDDPNLSKEIVKVIRMKMINKKYFYRVEDSKYLRMLTSETFIQILKRFEQSIYDPLATKYTIYSAHDSNLMNILTNLIQNEKILEYTKKAIDDQDIFDFLFPPYASSILFELYSFGDDYIVKINYNGKYLDKDLKYINVNNINDGEIKYKDFKLMMEQLIVNDYRKLVCDGKMIDQSSQKAMNYILKENKKDYQAHFLKRVKRKYD
jgi:acid phosphatase/lysosomal acid phosphatase/prostatic aicd phosphatase